MKKLLLTAFAVALSLSGGPAQAADLPVKAPRVDPAYNWNGFYVGGNIGYSWGKWNSTGFVVNGSDSPNVKGIIGGAQIGYNWLLINRWLLGLEGDFQFSGERKSTDWTTPVIVGVAVGGGLPVTNTWKLPWFATVRGRVGYAPNNWLFYFTGGVAFAEVKSELTTVGGSLSDSATKTGWTLGGGVEMALSRNWTAKIEYLYLNLGSRTFFANTATPVSSSLRDNVVRLGVNYKF